MPWWFTVSTFSRNPMTSADEVREIRERKLGMDRTAFGLALGIKGKGSAYAQVRKWEAGVVAPSDAALTAMRLLVELQECRRLPWMTEELWRTAQIAQNELRAMAEQVHMRAEYRTFCLAIQVLRALLEHAPKKG
jgi:DNA-binding transcriptional regulator YiaG